MPDETRTARLTLSRPQPDDIDPIHAIYSDPRVWTHFPSLRHTERDTTAGMLARWASSWDEAGLGPWIVRLAGSGELIGNGGCTLLTGDGGASLWNLGYRLSADHHGNGYATELSLAAVAEARRLRPDVPVIAYLVEHNRASASVAEKAGLRLVDRHPDAGNPDPDVMRLIYADRPLDEAQLSHARR